VDADRDDPSFEDGTGHVIGHFMADLPVAGEAGVLAGRLCAAVSGGRSAGSDVPRRSGERDRRLAARFSGLTAFAVEVLP
jgi:hypothetical protein